MENPAHWTAVHHVIDGAIRQHEDDMRAMCIGGSLPNAIYNALKAEGLLLEQPGATMNILFLDDMTSRHKKALKQFTAHEVLSVFDAKTAKLEMSKKRFDLVCLDHDLSDEHYSEHLTGVPPDSFDGSGTDVAKFMAEDLDPAMRPKQVILHSCNEYARDRMESILVNAGYENVSKKPFSSW